jgi:hypothetical protein
MYGIIIMLGPGPPRAYICACACCVQFEYHVNGGACIYHADLRLHVRVIHKHGSTLAHATLSAIGVEVLLRVRMRVGVGMPVRVACAHGTAL